MPVVVPTYTGQRELPSSPNQLPSVRLTAAPTADQLGANQRAPTDYVGRGLRDVATAAMAIQREREAREDADMVFRAETMARDRIRKQTADWSQRKGVQSWGLTAEAETWFDESFADISEGLSPRQRRAFDQTLSQLRQTSLSRLSIQEATERRASLDESASAAAASAMRFGLDNLDRTDESGNRVAIDAAREEIRRAVDVRANLQGWDPTRREIEIENSLTALHVQALTALQDSDPDAAQAYYKKYFDEIDPTRKAKLEKDMQSSTRLVKAQSFADDVEARGLSESEAMAEARRELSGEDEKFAVAEIQARFADRRRAIEEAQKELMGQARLAMGQSGSISRIPPSVWNRLDESRQAQLLERADILTRRREADASRVDAAAARAEREREAQAMRASFGNALGISDAIAAADPTRPELESEFREQIRAAYDRGDISKSDAERLIREARSRFNPTAGTDPENVKSAVITAGKRVAAGMKNWDRETRGAFESEYQKRVLEEQQVKGRQLTQAEGLAIANEMLAKGETERGWGLWETEETRFEAERKNRLDNWSPKDQYGTMPKTAAEVVAQKRPSKEIDGVLYYKFNGDWHSLL